MPGSVIIYRIEFQNKQLDTVLIEITDRQLYDSTGDNTVTYVSLKGVAPAFELETFNVEEDKFNPILGQRATIRFKSTNAVNFSTFSTGEDYRFFVRVTTGSSYLFNGWLVMDDNQQAFLPPGQPVTLYATDNFGALKDIELSDFNDARPKGKYKLITIIQWCLRKLEGPYPSEGSAIYDGIKVSMNLFESNHHSTVDNCPLNQTYVDVRTFEKNVDEYKDCYTVLTDILFSLGARVCQYNNFWYILRIDEYKNSAFVVHNYNLGGVYISRTLGATFDKDLDSSNIDFVEAQTIQRIQRAYKSSIVRKDYEFPDEIPANVNFTHGSLLTTAPPLKTFNLDDWTLLRGFGTHATTVNCAAEIWRKYNSLGYEIERYGVLTTPSSSGGQRNYIKSEAIPICEKDKFTFSFDYSANEDNSIDGPATIMVAALALYGDDSSVWILGDNMSAATDQQVPEWKLSDAQHDSNADYYQWFFSATSGSEDYRDWQSYSIEAPPAPVTGNVYLHFFAANQLGSAIDDFNIRFNNVKFEYAPLVNGSYTQFTAEQYKMSTDLRYSKKWEENYTLFDAPCKLYKGAMFYLDTGVYYNTANWIDFAMEQYAIPDLLDFAYVFLHWQCNAVWNQNRLETRLLPARLFGMDVSNGYAGLIHKYSVLNDPNYSGLNFIILSMRQDWHNCTWSATFAAINDESNVRQGGGSNGENFEFKYLS